MLLVSMQTFGSTFSENFVICKSTWTIRCAHSYEMFSVSDICFRLIRWFDKFLSWTASIYTWVDTKTSIPDSIENLPLLKRENQSFLASYEGHCSSRVLRRSLKIYVPINRFKYRYLAIAGSSNFFAVLVIILFCKFCCAALVWFFDVILNTDKSNKLYLITMVTQYFP